MNTEELLAKAKKPSADAMKLHPFYRGKIETTLKCTVHSFDDFAIWYTPGVAAPCKAIQADPELVYEYTNKGNSIAVVSDDLTKKIKAGDLVKALAPILGGKGGGRPDFAQTGWKGEEGIQEALTAARALDLARVQPQRAQRLCQIQIGGSRAIGESQDCLRPNPQHREERSQQPSSQESVLPSPTPSAMLR